MVDTADTAVMEWMAAAALDIQQWAAADMAAVDLALVLAALR